MSTSAPGGGRTPAEMARLIDIELDRNEIWD
jgi:hypothetical protein